MVSKISRQTKSLLGTIISSIPHAIAWQDKDLIYRGANKIFTKLFIGTNNPAEIIGQSVFDLNLTPEIATFLHGSDEEILETGLPATTEVAICNPSGHEIIISTTKSRIENEDGKVEGLVSVSFDVTMQRLAEKDLAEREVFLRNQNMQLFATLSDRYKFGEIVGKSQVMQDMYGLILSAGYSDANVLIRGEHGSGRRLVGKTIFQQSRKIESGIEYINSDVSDHEIRETLFGTRRPELAVKESSGSLILANQGTLFLDGVEKLSLEIQGELLNALSYGFIHPISKDLIKVNVRLICSTAENLRELVTKGLMRQDFLFFIQIIIINVPSLRDRKEDIPLLVDFFLREYDQESTRDIDPITMKALQDYNWPGNIQELKNTIQRYVALGKLDFLGPIGSTEPHLNYADEEWESLGAAIEDLEKTMILKALEKHDWHQTHTSEDLGIDRKTLAKKMKIYNLFTR